MSQTPPPYGDQPPPPEGNPYTLPTDPSPTGQPTPPPAYGQPTYPQPTYAQPGYSQPLYGQQPAYGQPVQGQPAYGQQGYATGFLPPNHQQSTTVLVLGILSIVLCGVLGPIAWVMGNRVIKEIDASNGHDRRPLGGPGRADLRDHRDGVDGAHLPDRDPDLRPGHRRLDHEPLSTAPGRPPSQLTEDGRRVREVVSYARRGHRFTPSEQEAWDAHHEAWVIPPAAVEDDGLRWADWFGRDAPMAVEIGSGVGEATVALAASRPECDVLALEVWNPGIAATLGRLGRAGVTNVRLAAMDADWTLEHRIAPSSLGEVWTFFPDPWPKTRHHKRRLVKPSFAALVASRLAPGGWWRLATDWADYADQMRAVLDAESTLEGRVVERWSSGR